MNFLNSSSPLKEQSSWRILMIDDDEDDFVLVRQMLSEAREGKYDLEWVSSLDQGEYALSSDRSYNALIVDYDLGRYSGIELIRYAISQAYPAPILLLTGRGTYEVDVEAMEAGASDYLSKGEINAAFLERAIRYAIDRKKATIEREQLLTEQHHQREFLERLVNYAPIAIAVVEGEELRYRMVNPTYQAIVGTDIQIVGKTYREIFPEAANRGAEEAMCKVLQTGEPWPVRDFQTPIPGREGMTWWEGEVLPLPKGNGERNELLILTWEITQRKQGEEALRASEERERARAAELETLMNAVPAMIWISRDPDCREMIGNQLGYEFLKMWSGANISKTAPSEAQVLQPYRNYKDGREIPIEELPMQIAASKGIAAHGYEYDLVFEDDSQHRLFGNVTPIFDHSGKPSGAIGAFIDITPRQKMEEMLRHSEERYRTLFSSMRNGFALHEIICDDYGKPVDYRFYEMNPAFERLTGLSSVKIQGKTVREVLPEIEPFWIETYGNVALTGKAVQFEQYASALDRYFQVYAFCPKLGQFATIFSDITERKRTEDSLRESEERFRALFNNRHSIMLVIDPETTQIVDANPAACLFYGWSRDELVGMMVTDINTLPVDQTRQNISEAEGTSSSVTFHFRHRIASGEIRDVAVHSGPIYIGGKEYLFSIIHDVTEHKRMEKALLEGEVKYRTFFDNLRETVVLYEAVRDADGQVIDWVFLDINELALSNLGLERNQVIGKRANELFGPDVIAPYSAEYSQVLASGEPSIHEVTNQGKTFLVTVFWMGGNMVATTGIEITEHKKMGRALQQAHDRAAWLARLPEESPNPVVRASADGRVLYHNPVAAILPGWNCRLNEFVDGPLLEIIQQAIQEKSEVQEDLFLEGKFYSVSVMPYLEDNYVNLYGQDVTERRETEGALREAEERFRVALSNTSIAVFSTDLNLRYTWFYSTAMGSLPERFIGKRDDEIIPAENAVPLLDLKQRVILERKALSEETVLDIGKRKEILIASIEPFWDRDGGLLGVIGSLYDITEQRRLESEINEHHTEMEVQRRLTKYRESERQKLAHYLHDGPTQDLSSLIFSIQLSIEAIEDLKIKSELEQIRSRVKETVQDLREMINELRPPSLIRFGVVRAIQFHAEGFRQKHSEIEVEMNLKPLDENVHLSEQLNLTLFHVYQEAISNIVHHSKATKVWVNIEQDEDTVQLKIRDNGKGIAESQNIYDFTNNQKFGLAGLSERVEAVNGDLQVISHPGKGTTIMVTVPIKQ